MTLCLGAAAVMPALAQEQVENFTAKLFTAKGTVEVQKKGGAGWAAVKAPFMLDAGDQVRTGRKSKAELYMKYGSKVRLEADTTFEINRISHEENSVAVLKGRMQAWIRKFAGRNFTVRTPAAVCAVRGTVFGVEVAETGDATWDLFNGAIQVSAPLGNFSVNMLPGQRLQMTIIPPPAPPAPQPLPLGIKPPVEPAKTAEERAEMKAEKALIDAKGKEEAAAKKAAEQKAKAAEAAAKAAAEKAAAEKAAAEAAAAAQPAVVDEPVFIPVVVPTVEPSVIPTATVQESQEVSGSTPDEPPAEEIPEEPA
jgi:hypothetical protein